MSSDKEKLNEIAELLKADEKNQARILLTEVADSFASRGLYRQAANLYEKAGVLAKDLYRADECFGLMESATVMLLRMSDLEVHPEIVRLNIDSGKIAENATEYRMAADFYMRATDFAASDEEKDELMIKAADALEILADIKEEEGSLEDAVGILKRVGSLYYSAGDSELGSRIFNRAIKIANRWAEESRLSGDFLSAGNALAEAAQLMQDVGDTIESIRVMMDAGELYESVELFEKAGNIYDAAQEAYKLQRLSNARKQAMFRAAEAYLKMQGRPEVIAPLLFKAGEMFTEIGRPMKAKWAYKNAGDLFAELATIAKRENDNTSEKTYLRHQAISLKKSGMIPESNDIFKEVITYYLSQAKKEKDKDNKEAHALALEEAADVLYEAGHSMEATEHLERAIEVYVQLAEAASESGALEDASRFYSRAAVCAEKLGDEKRMEAFYGTASKKAEAAADDYMNMEIPELATLWFRTAGLEALKTSDRDLLDRGIDLLGRAADGFEEAKEYQESFEDLFSIFEALVFHPNSKKRAMNSTLKKMEEIAKISPTTASTAVMSVLRPLVKGNYTASILSLQEHEEELPDKRNRLRKIIDFLKE